MILLYINPGNFPANFDSNYPVRIDRKSKTAILPNFCVGCSSPVRKEDVNTIESVSPNYQHPREYWSWWRVKISALMVCGWVSSHGK